MVSYIFVVAITNLILGFAMAVYVARRYRELVALSSEPSASTLNGLPEVSEEGVAGGSPSANGQAEPDVPPEPQCGPSPCEASLEELKQQVQHYYRQLSSLDNAVRTGEETRNATAVESCLKSLQEANQGFLKSRHLAHQALGGLEQQGEQLHAVRVNLQAAVEQQAAQIEQTADVIENFDYQTDPGQGCGKIISETTKLLNVHHKLRDTLDEASVGLARTENRLGLIDDAMQQDPMTGLSTRVALEAYLAEWWEKDLRRVRQLSVGMIDMDQFMRVNQRYSHGVGNRVLHAIAQFLIAESRRNDMAARFSGQRFLVFLSDVDVRFAFNAIERIRQTIEVARFEYRQYDFQVTVSCGVTEARPEDTSETLFARAELTLQEAKRYGGNRTFIHEGKYPTPLVPPNFTLEAKCIQV